jgi:hypothetical protein
VAVRRGLSVAAPASFTIRAAISPKAENRRRQSLAAKALSTAKSGAVLKKTAAVRLVHAPAPATASRCLRSSHRPTPTPQTTHISDSLSLLFSRLLALARRSTPGVSNSLDLRPSSTPRPG